jgi:tryptophan 2,3-dioxygenase
VKVVKAARIVAFLLLIQDSPFLSLAERTIVNFLDVAKDLKIVDRVARAIPADTAVWTVLSILVLGDFTNYRCLLPPSSAFKHFINEATRTGSCLQIFSSVC